MTCRKDRIHNRLQAKKDDPCFEEQGTKVQDEYEECSDIIDTKPSNYEEVTKKIGNTSLRRMMSRMQYRYMKGIS